MRIDHGFLHLPGPLELLLVGVVSLQVTAIAYLRAPRWKALVLCLPFPFTVVALSLGRPIDATHVLGLVAILLYVHGVRFMYQGIRLPIVPAIVLSLAAYFLISLAAVHCLPAAPAAFWVACPLTFFLGLYLYLRLPARAEPGHRTPLPVWVKLPVVAAVVFLLLTVKEALQGFATLFPMVSVVGAYEARHSLWTLGRQLPVMILTMIPLMVVSRLTQGYVGFAGSLALGWCAFLAALVPLTRALWTRQSPL
jgi:hypothetical protein